MEVHPTVVLFTGSYPYDLRHEDSFLSPELPHLRREFGRVLVVPAARGGEAVALPADVEIDETLAVALAGRPGRLRTLLDAFSSPLIPHEIRHRVRPLRSAVALRRLIGFAAAATRVARWYDGFARHQNLDPRSTILYSYWLDFFTAGLVLARLRQPSLVVVSRGHRYDVYEEDQTPPYLPCREWLMEHLDRVFLVSKDACTYLQCRHPVARDRLVVARLGTPEPGFLTVSSADGVLRVVSCSAVIPIKQVDVLARGLILAAQQRPQRAIDWRHTGDGPLRPEIEALLTSLAPGNLSWGFRGQVANAEVLGRYRSHPADLFANTSRREGVPVSIMEAQSCGIPAIAPAVGGVREVVSPENGWLLPCPVSPLAVAEVIMAVLDAPRCLPSRRERSRRDWEEGFDAGRNLARFAKELLVLRRGLEDRPL